MKIGVPGFYGERLRQAREAMGLSITSLAALVGISKQAISQYERGADAPSQHVFDALRATLRQDGHFFLRRPSDSLKRSTCFYRSMSAATKTARTKAEVWQYWFRELVAYVLEHVELPRLNFPDFSGVPLEPNMIPIGQIEAMAGDVREFWKLGDGPITSLVSTAENNGAVITRHRLDADTLDALSEWLSPEDFPLIVLNADKNVGVRSRLDIAHELGHMFLHRHIASSNLRRTEFFNVIEDQAFRFGAALLLPEHSFLEDLYSLSLDGLLALKHKWKVSVAMMIERLRRLNILTDDQYRRLRINYSARQWNKAEPYDDEIAVEQPTVIVNALRLMVQENVQTIDQISATTGLSREWIGMLLNLPPDMDRPGIHPKVIEFKLRA